MGKKVSVDARINGTEIERERERWDPSIKGGSKKSQFKLFIQLKVCKRIKGSYIWIPPNAPQICFFREPPTKFAKELSHPCILCKLLV